MPDLAQLGLLVALGGLAAVVVALPLLRRRRGGGDDWADEHEALALRHRIAIEALRDVEADRRAGSLDDAGYARQRAEAEQRAAATLAELEAGEAAKPAAVARSAVIGARRARRYAAFVGLLLAGLLLAGFFVPAPIGLANPTVDTRQQAIDGALARLQVNPRDAGALSDLADVLASGDSYADMQRAATAYIALIALEPDNTGAYNRLITTYIRVADWKDASATTDALAKVAPDSPEVPFFRGLIALQGSNDVATARREFAKFEQLAPDDPRVPMVRSLVSPASPSPASPAASASPASSASVSPSPVSP
jgi:cytochrome c-type biogenesis protein CcmI